jgi:hypothetical protein
LNGLLQEAVEIHELQQTLTQLITPEVDALMAGEGTKKVLSEDYAPVGSQVFEDFSKANPAWGGTILDSSIYYGLNAGRRYKENTVFEDGTRVFEAKDVKPGTYVVGVKGMMNPDNPQQRKSVEMIENLRKKFLPEETIYFLDDASLRSNSRSDLGFATYVGDADVFIVRVQPKRDTDQAVTTAHEFGHIFWATKLAKMDLKDKYPLYYDFFRWVQGINQRGEEESMRAHESVLGRVGGSVKFSKDKRGYWPLRADEYFANQFARYMTNPESVSGPLKDLLGEFKGVVEEALEGVPSAGSWGVYQDGELKLTFPNEAAAKSLEQDLREDFGNDIQIKPVDQGKPSFGVELFFRDLSNQARLGELMIARDGKQAQDFVKATQESGMAGLDAVVAEQLVGVEMARKIQEVQTSKPFTISSFMKNAANLIGSAQEQLDLHQNLARLRRVESWYMTLPQINWRFNGEGLTIPGLQYFTDLVGTKMPNDRMIFILEADAIGRLWKKTIKSKRENVAFSNFLNEMTLESDKIQGEIGYDRNVPVEELLNEDSRTGQEIMDQVGIPRSSQRRLWAFYAENIKPALRNDITRVYEAIKKNVAFHYPENLELPDGDAYNISQRRKQREELTALDEELNRLSQKNYFPLKRHGTYTLKAYAPTDGFTYRDRVFKKGELITFDQFEGKGERKAYSADLKRLVGGANVVEGRLPENSANMLALPPRLLQLMMDRVFTINEDLTLAAARGDVAARAQIEQIKEQRAQMTELAKELAPERSFRHQLQRRKGRLGYSEDAYRSLMSYFSQVGNFYTRLNNMNEIDQAISMVREQQKLGLEEGANENNETLDEVINFMTQHRQFIRDPGPQYTNLTSLGFLKYLGGNISSALVNLYQLPMATASMLTGEYGIKANANIAGNLGNVWRLWTAAKNTALERDKGAGSEMRVVQDLMRKSGYPQDVVEALQLGVDIQLLDQSYSREVAAAGTAKHFGTIVPKAFLGSRKAGQSLSFLSYLLSGPFSVTEKVIRLVTYKSTYELERDRLLKERFDGKKMEQIPWHSREAILTEAAKKAQKITQLTQNEYSLWARPKGFRGGLAPLMLFKSFLQGQLYLSGRLFYGTKAEKKGAALFLGQIALLGGILGLPGADDLWELFRKGGRGLFGGEDPEIAAKRAAGELLGVFKDPEMADALFHGFGQYTMAGVPHSGLLYKIIDDLPMFEGTMVQDIVRNIPKTDLAQRTTFGSLQLGFDDLLLAMMSYSDPKEAGFYAERGLKELVGPFSAMVYDAGVSAWALSGMAYTALNKGTDAITEKQIRAAIKGLPTFAGNAINAWRAGESGAVKDYDGSTIIEYDWSNPNDLRRMQDQYALGMKAIGFANTAENQVRERNWAYKQMVYYWQGQRKSYLDWYDQILQSEERDPDAMREFWKNARDFNRNAPPAYVITPDVIIRSISARNRGRNLKEAGLYGPRAIWSDIKGLEKYYPVTGAGE